MRRNNNEKGITLIVLVVTIILMIILSTVVLTSSFEGGIVDESLNTRNETLEFEKDVNEDQQNLLEWIAQ